MNSGAGSGAPLKFKTPAKMWEVFQDYKTWAEINPILKPHCLKDGTIVDIPIKRPYTMYDFATFCGMSKQGVDNYVILESHKAFFGVYARIHNEISSQRIAGAMCDVYNANLTARMDKISDKQEVDANVKNEDNDVGLSIDMDFVFIKKICK